MQQLCFLHSTHQRYKVLEQICSLGQCLFMTIKKGKKIFDHLFSLTKMLLTGTTGVSSLQNDCYILFVTGGKKIKKKNTEGPSECSH